MDNIKEYIESGVLELYVLGVAGAKEKEEVERMALLYPEISKEIANISAAIETYGHLQAIVPDPTIKPFLMAMIDYNDRLANGEQPSFPPVINEHSSISDYEAWINREDINLPDDFKDFHAKIIGYTPGALTAVLWIKEGAPEEIHQHELEKFLILEGTCDITIEGDVYHLGAGDFLSIPLYKKHHVSITSSIPCKLILQRLAA